MSRKVGGRGHAIIEDCVDATKQRLEDYKKNAGEDSSQLPETI